MGNKGTWRLDTHWARHRKYILLDHVDSLSWSAASALGTAPSRCLENLLRNIYVLIWRFVVTQSDEVHGDSISVACSSGSTILYL